MNRVAGRLDSATVPDSRVDDSLRRRITGRVLSWIGVTVGVAGAIVPLHAPAARTSDMSREHAQLSDALRGPAPLLGAETLAGDDPAKAVDGRDDTWWVGRAGENEWRLAFGFARPAHLGLLRVHWGRDATSGVPIEFRWEALRPDPDSTACPAVGEAGDRWTPLAAADQSRALWNDRLAQPTRRSWFVDAMACGLRLVVERTNMALPVVREVQAIESASDVLRGARASADGAYPGLEPNAAIDGSYATRWAGSPGRSRWSLRVDLPAPETIDRIRLVLGFDAGGAPRADGGLSYAAAWSPVRYTLEASEDGKRFGAIATEPRRANGTVLPVRRRLVSLSSPRRVRALRLTMISASGADGTPEPGALPVVRELAAYRADDPRPILAPPWLLSVNANPSGQTLATPRGVRANDAFHAKFLQTRFRALLPALRGDDQFDRALGPRGEWSPPTQNDDAGEALESIEGDDPELDGALLAASSPPPVVILSGSNDWDYAAETGPDAEYPGRWHWDPLSETAGMGRLAAAVQRRVAPFVGFCGGAQILALLEALHPGAAAAQDLRTIDQVLWRTSGRAIRGFAPSPDVERAWPTDPASVRTLVRFAADSPLFSDMAGPTRRTTTRALPEWHADAIRPDAFDRGGPLERLSVMAESAFCAPDVLGPAREGVFADPQGDGYCLTVPEVFRSRERAWPIIGAQFHPEQRDFANPAPGDPPESIADAQLFVAAVYEELVSAYASFGP